MRTVIAFLALSVTVSMAQTPLPIPLPNLFPPQLKEYLGLSDDQVTRINTVNSQLASSQSSKVPRQFQLQSEITQELAKPTPDPLTLGVRYAELETIRRDLQNSQTNAVNLTQAILNAAQKTKLATLQQALALTSTACSAVSQNLLPAPNFVYASLGQITGVLSSSPWFDTTSYASALLQTVASPCAGASVPSVRSGVFTTAP